MALTLEQKAKHNNVYISRDALYKYIENCVMSCLDIGLVLLPWETII